MEILSSRLCDQPVRLIKKKNSFDFFSVEYDKLGKKIIYSNERTALFAEKYSKNSFLKGNYSAAREWRIFYPKKNSQDPGSYQHLAQLGYNAIILTRDDQEEAVLARQYDLKVILSVDGLSQLPPNLEKLSNFIKNLKDQISFDALFWRSAYFEADCRSHLLETSKLKIELILEELCQLELLTPIFYALPQKSQEETGFLDRHFSFLEQHAGPNTLLAFSTYDGPPDWNFLPKSPYWKMMKTKSLPIIGGFEESLFLNFCEEKNRFIQDAKKGSIIVGDFLSPNLEAMGIAMWGLDFNKSSSLDKDHFASLNSFSVTFKKLSCVKSGHFNLPFEELKAEIDLLLAQIKVFEYKFQKIRSLDSDHENNFLEIELFIEKLKELSQDVSNGKKG